MTNNITRHEARNKIRKLKQEIAICKSNKKELVRQLSYHNSNKVELFHQINYHDDILKKHKLEIEIAKIHHPADRHLPHAPNHVTYLVSLALLLAFLGIVVFFEPTYTGFAIYEQTYHADIFQIFDNSTNYAIALNSTPTSFKLSGSIIGNGTAIIRLINQNSDLAIGNNLTDYNNLTNYTDSNNYILLDSTLLRTENNETNATSIDSLPFNYICAETCSNLSINSTDFTLEITLNNTSIYLTRLDYTTLVEEVVVLPEETNLTSNITDETIINLTNETILLNATNITDDTLNETILISANSTNLTTITTQQLSAEINKPVRWIKRISSTENKTTIDVEIPQLATISEVRKVIENNNRDSNNTDNITDSTIIISPIREDKVIIPRVRFSSQAFSADDNKTITINESTSKNEALEILYETTAPAATEQQISETEKHISINSDFHYENVFTYTTITETPLDKEDSIVVFWIEDNNESKRQLFANITKLDTNNNSLIDRLEWFTPHLSPQLFIVWTNYSLALGTLNNNTVNDVFVDANYSYIATNGGLQIFFTKNNSARLNISGTFKSVFALNNLVYLGNTSGLYVFNNDNTLTFNRSFTTILSPTSQAGDSNLKDINCKTISSNDYCLLATNKGSSLINISDNTVINNLDGGSMNVVKITPNPDMVLANTTHLLRGIDLENNAKFAKELPDNKTSNSWFNMTGNVLLYHLNNDTAYLENQSFVKDFSYTGNDADAANSTPNSTSSVIRGSYTFIPNTAGTTRWLQTVSTANINSINFTGKTELSVMAWVRPTAATTGTNYIVSSDWNGVADSPFALTLNIGRPEFNIYNGSRTSTSLGSTALSNEVWHHLVGVWNGTHTSIWVDGTLNNTDAEAGSIGITTNARVWINRRSASSTFLNISMDEIAIWNRSLSTSEISNIYNTQKAWYYNLTNTTSLSNINALESDANNIYAGIKDGLLKINSTTFNPYNFNNNFKQSNLVALWHFSNGSTKNSIPGINSLSSEICNNESGIVGTGCGVDYNDGPTWTQPTGLATHMNTTGTLTLTMWDYLNHSAQSGSSNDEFFRINLQGSDYLRAYVHWNVANAFYLTLNSQLEGVEPSKTSSYGFSWHHNAWTFNWNLTHINVTWYRDGDYFHSTIARYVGFYLRDGSSFNIPNGLNGTIDEVRIYNTSLTQPEIRDVMYQSRYAYDGTYQNILAGSSNNVSSLAISSNNETLYVGTIGPTNSNTGAVTEVNTTSNSQTAYWNTTSSRNIISNNVTSLAIYGTSSFADRNQGDNYLVIGTSEGASSFSWIRVNPNITIINQTNPTNIPVNSTHPIYIGQNISFYYNISDTEVSKVWVAVWADAINGNYIITNKSLAVAGDLYTTQIYINGSFVATRQYNYTIYANDTAGNFNSFNYNFSVNGSFNPTIFFTKNVTLQSIRTEIFGRLNMSETNVTNEIIGIYINGTKLTQGNFQPVGNYQLDQNNYTTTNGKLSNNTVNDVFVDNNNYYLATNGGLQILYINNNSAKLNLTGNFKSVFVLNNIVYLGNASGIWAFNNNATLGFNKSHTINVTSVNDIDCIAFSGLDYCAIATDSGVRVWNFTSNRIVNSTDTAIVKAVKFDKSSSGGQFVFSNTTHLLRSTNLTSIFDNEEYALMSNMTGLWHLGNGDDFTGNPHRNLTISGDEVFYKSTPYRFGNGSLFVNGTNDYLQAVNAVGYGSGAKEMSAMAWVKSDFAPADGSYYAIVARFGTNVGVDRYFQLSYRDVGSSTSRLRVGVIDTVNTSNLAEDNYGSVYVMDGNWHHVAMTINFNTGEMFGYIDGNRSSSLTTLNTSLQIAPEIANQALTIGGGVSGLANWNGSIDEVAIFDRALTPQEIQDYYFKFRSKNATAISNINALETTPTDIFVGTSIGALKINSTRFNPYNYDNSFKQSNLVALFHLDNSSANSITSSANLSSYNATCASGINGQIHGGYKVKEDSCDTDGITWSPSAAETTMFNTSQAITLTFWDKSLPTGFSGSAEYIFAIKPSLGYYQLNKHASVTEWYFTCFNGTGGAAQGQTNFNPGNLYGGNIWRHNAIVLEFNPTAKYINVTYYRDGQLMKTDGCGTGYAGLVNNFDIGTVQVAHYNGGNTLNATIDEIRIYNTSFTQKEILDLIYQSRYSINGTYQPALAGRSSNVTAFALTADNNTLYVGTGNGDNSSGAVSEININTNTQNANWSNLTSPLLVDYDIRALATNANNSIATLYNGTLLIGTDAGATSLEMRNTKTDYLGNYNYSFINLAQAGNFTVIVNSTDTLHLVTGSGISTLYVDLSAPTISIINQTDHNNISVNITNPAQLGQNITFRYSAADFPAGLTSSTGAWLTIWVNAVNGAVAVISNKSMTGSSSLYSLPINLNFSFSARTYNYTVYVNDSVGNTGSFNYNFTVNGSMQITASLTRNVTRNLESFSVFGSINLSDGFNVTDNEIDIYINTTKIDRGNFTPADSNNSYSSSNFTLSNGKLSSNNVNDVFADGTYYYVATNTSLDILFANNNSARLNKSGNFNSVYAITDLVFAGNASGLFIFNNDATLSLNRSYTSQLINSSVNNIYCKSINNVVYCAVATNAGLSIVNYTGNTTVYNSTTTASQPIKAVIIDPNNNLIWANSSTNLLRKYNVQNIAANFAHDNATTLPNINALEATSAEIIVGTGDQGVLVINDSYFETEINESGLALWYPFDADATSDLGPGKYNLTSVIGLTTTTASYIGPKALKATGLSYNRRTAADVQLDFDTKPLTLETWVYPIRTDGSPGAIIQLSNVSNPAFIFGIDTTNNRTDLRYSSSAMVGATGDVSLNAWHYVVLVRNDTHTYFYVDGKLSGTPSTGFNTWNATVINGSIYVAQSTGGGNIFNGTIDDIKIHKNYAFTQAEITKRYNARRYHYLTIGNISSILAGSINNVSSLALTSNKETLYVGTSNADNSSGAVSEINLASNTQSFNFTNISEFRLIDADIRSLHTSTTLPILSAPSGNFLLATDSGVMTIGHLITRADNLANYNYTISSPNSEGTYTILVNATSRGVTGTGTSTLYVDLTVPTISFVNQTDQNNNTVNATNPVQFAQNITFRYSAADFPAGLTLSTGAWLTIWEDAVNGAVAVINNKSMSGSSALYSLPVNINSSFAARTYNYTVYINDSVGNTAAFNYNFTVNGSMQITASLTRNVTRNLESFSVFGSINLSHGFNVTDNEIGIYINTTRISIGDFTPVSTNSYRTENYTTTNAKLSSNNVNDVFTDGTYYYIATNSSLQVLFANNNSARVNISGNFKSVYVLNNLVYLGNTSGIWAFNNNATLVFNKSHTGNVSNVNDIDCTTFSGLDYCAIATDSGVRVWNFTSNIVANSTDTAIVRAVKFDKSSSFGHILYANTSHLLRSATLSTIFNQDEYSYDTNMTGWWHMENTNDSSGINSDFTLFNGADFVTSPAKFGKAVDVNYTKYIEIGTSDATKLFNNKSELTVNLWVYMNSNPVDPTSSIFDYANGTTYRIAIEASSSGPRITCTTKINGIEDASAIIGSPVAYDTWFLASYIFNGTHIICYANGVAGTPVRTNFTNITGAAEWDIGQQQVGVNLFDGLVDEIAVYNRAWTQQEILDYFFKFRAKNTTSISNINTLESNIENIFIGSDRGVSLINASTFSPGAVYANTTNVVGWWHMDDLTDSSGNGFTLSLLGSGHINSTIAKFGSSLSVNGTSSGATLADSSALRFYNNASAVSVWINFHNSSGRMDAIDKAGWAVSVPTTHLPYCYFRPTGWYVEDTGSTTITINEETWNNIVCTREVDMISNRTTTRIYVNGMPSGVYSVVQTSPSYLNNTNSLNFGYSTNGHFNGSIDEVRIIIGRNVTSEEIWENYIGTVYTLNGTNKVLAGNTNNVTALTLSTDNKTLYVGTSNGDSNSGAITEINLSTNTQIFNFTNTSTLKLIDYDIRSLHANVNSSVTKDLTGSLLLATDSGAMTLSHLVPKTDSTASYNYTISSPNTDGIYTVIINSTSRGVTGRGTATLHVDLTPPIINITFPLNNSALSSLVLNRTINWSVTDPYLQSCWYSLNKAANVSVLCNQTYANITAIVSIMNNFTFYANDSMGNTNGTTIFFRMNVEPSVPVLLTPANGSSKVYTNLTFTWNSSTDTEGDNITYEIALGNNISFTAQLHNATTSRTNYTNTSVYTNGIQYWKVRAYDGIDYSNYSTPNAIDIIYVVLNVTYPGNYTIVYPSTTYTINVSVTNRTDWVDNISIQVTNDGTEATTVATPINNSFWQVSYEITNLTPRDLTIVARGYNGSIVSGKENVNTSSIMRLTKAQGASIASPIITIYPNQTNVAVNGSVKIITESTLGTLLHSIVLTLTYPNGTQSNLSIAESSENITALKYLRNYTFSSGINGTHNLSLRVVDINGNANTGTTTVIYSTSTAITLTAIGSTNIKLKDYQSGTTLINNVSGSTSIVPGTYNIEIETSKPIITLIQGVINENTTTVATFIDSAETVTPPTKRRSVDTFIVNASVAFSNANISYNYSSIEESLSEETNLEVYKCASPSNCTLTQLTVIIDSTNNIIHFTTSNFSVFMLAEPTTTVITSTITVNSNIVNTKTEQVEVTKTRAVSFEIIVPPIISLKPNDNIKIPVIVRNTGQVALQGIAFNADSQNKDIQLQLDKSLIPALLYAGQDRLSLDVTPKTKPGRYEVVIQGISNDPQSTARASLYVDVIDEDNQTDLKMRLEFAQALLKENSECLDMQELLDLAKKAMDDKEGQKAKSLIESSINACKQLIRLVTVREEKPAAIEIPKTQQLLSNTRLIVLLFVILAVTIYLTFMIKNAQQNGNGNHNNKNHTFVSQLTGMFSRKKRKRK